MIEDSQEADYVIEVHDFSGESKEISFEVEVCCGQDTFCYQRRYPMGGEFIWTIFHMNRKGIETWNLTNET